MHEKFCFCSNSGLTSISQVMAWERKWIVWKFSCEFMKQKQFRANWMKFMPKFLSLDWQKNPFKNAAESAFQFFFGKKLFFVATLGPFFIISLFIRCEAKVVDGHFFAVPVFRLNLEMKMSVYCSFFLSQTNENFAQMFLKSMSISLISTFISKF